MNTKITTDYEPCYDSDKLGGLLGAKDSSDMSPSLIKKIEFWSEELSERMEPNVSYITKRIDNIEDGRIRLEGGVDLKSSKICKVLGDCDRLVVFIATVGSYVSARISRLMKSNRMTDAYLADAISSVAVESIVDQFHMDMEAEYRRKGNAVTIRFSPGYCDWNISEQKKLFQLMNEKDHRVELMDSYLMRPSKSISGIFGVWPYKVGGSIASYNPCLECGKKDCIARRA